MQPRGKPQYGPPMRIRAVIDRWADLGRRACAREPCATRCVGERSRGNACDRRPWRLGGACIAGNAAARAEAARTGGGASDRGRRARPGGDAREPFTGDSGRDLHCDAARLLLGWRALRRPPLARRGGCCGRCDRRGGPGAPGRVQRERHQTCGLVSVRDRVARWPRPAAAATARCRTRGPRRSARARA